MRSVRESALLNWAGLARVSRWAAVAALVAAYSLLLHYANASPGAATLGAALLAAPLMLIALVLAWRSSRRPMALTLYALGLALVWRYWPALERHFDVVGVLQHAAFNALLAWAFGGTLAQGREPMCARFARLVHGPLPPEVAAYTRQVTLAWTLFFIVMASASLLLYVLAPLEIWSAFANLLTLPLVALMFAVEYLVRLRVLPDFEHASIVAGVRAFWRSS